MEQTGLQPQAHSLDMPSRISKKSKLKLFVYCMFTQKINYSFFYQAELALQKNLQLFGVTKV